MASSLADVELVVAQSGYTIRLASAIAFTILFYDYVITFYMEIERFWRRGRPNLVACGFFLNRYLSLLGHVPVIIEFYGSHDQLTCTRLQMYHQIFAGVTQVIVGLLQVLRVRALYSGSRAVLFFLLGMCVVGCIVSGWAVNQSWQARWATAFDHDPRLVARVGCDLTMSEVEGIYTAAVWAAVLVFDAIVFGLTAYRVLQVGRKWRGSLFTLMLRDGAVYFGALAMCHLANILTCLLAQVCISRSLRVLLDLTAALTYRADQQPAYRGISVTTTNVIATSLITRLMLNIRDPAARDGLFYWPSDLDLGEEKVVTCRCPWDRRIPDRTAV